MLLLPVEVGSDMGVNPPSRPCESEERLVFGWPGFVVAGNWG